MSDTIEAIIKSKRLKDALAAAATQRELKALADRVVEFFKRYGAKAQAESVEGKVGYSIRLTHLKHSFMSGVTYFVFPNDGKPVLGYAEYSCSKEADICDHDETSLLYYVTEIDKKHPGELFDAGDVARAELAEIRRVQAEVRRKAANVKFEAKMRPFRKVAESTPGIESVEVRNCAREGYVRHLRFAAVVGEDRYVYELDVAFGSSPHVTRASGNSGELRSIPTQSHWNGGWTAANFVERLADDIYERTKPKAPEPIANPPARRSWY